MSLAQALLFADWGRAVNARPFSLGALRARGPMLHCDTPAIEQEEC